MITTLELNTLPELSLDVEELESMEAPWNWDAYFGGVGLGFAGWGLYLGAAALT